MNEKRVPSVLPAHSPEDKSAPVAPTSPAHWKRTRVFPDVCLLVLLAAFLVNGNLCEQTWSSTISWSGDLGSPLQTPVVVEWQPCDGQPAFGCTNVELPLDHDSPGDSRTVTIALARYKATRGQKRQGAIFLNPGGPGFSGKQDLFERATQLSTIVDGRFDLIGFDPRGTGDSKPRVSCFPNEAQAERFRFSMNDFSLNLPGSKASLSMPDVKSDIQRQVEIYTNGTSLLAVGCYNRTGDALAYMGTQAVVHDIDQLSRLIEGNQTPINFWGFSYGSIIGQYMVKILDPKRIGRVIIDGIVDPTVWSNHSKFAFQGGLEDIDRVLLAFATTCFNNSVACPLRNESASPFNFTHPEALLVAIDLTLDSLYRAPVPTSVGLPDATASHLRTLLFAKLYRPTSWPDLADFLVQAFNNNFINIVRATMVHVNEAQIETEDYPVFAPNVIVCADTKPYDDPLLEPSSDELTKLVLQGLQQSSSRLGDRFFDRAMCHAWDRFGLLPRKSRYGGNFGLPNNTLVQPMLIISNTLDPVASLASAKAANDRLGNNSILIEQRDGVGHCSLAHPSKCTFKTIREYMVDGEWPHEKHSMCEVEEVPWKPRKRISVFEDLENAEPQQA